MLLFGGNIFWVEWVSKVKVEGRECMRSNTVEFWRRAEGYRRELRGGRGLDVWVY